MYFNIAGFFFFWAFKTHGALQTGVVKELFHFSLFFISYHALCGLSSRPEPFGCGGCEQQLWGGSALPGPRCAGISHLPRLLQAQNVGIPLLGSALRA